MTAPADFFGLVGVTLDGKYDVERVVAEGGFGVVYRATHCGLRRPVAIKVLRTPAHLDAAPRAPFLEKFAPEARLIADLDHPAIVRVLDFGVGPVPNGEVAPWMVLEWLDGTPLEDDLEARRGAGGRSPAEALALLRPALEALAVAHEAGVAHRDLKPANLMRARGRRGESVLRVLDFGIAKVMRDDRRRRLPRGLPYPRGAVHRQRRRRGSDSLRAALTCRAPPHTAGVPAEAALRGTIGLGPQTRGAACVAEALEFRGIGGTARPPHGASGRSF